MATKNLTAIELEIKPNFDNENTICRCCFQTGKIVYDIATFHVHFLDIAGINVMDLDDFPRWICYECRALLLKAYRFKQQVIKAHKLWFNYINRCAPFPVHGQDVELKSYSRPHLLETETLCLDVSNWEGDVLQHKKQVLETELTLTNLVDSSTVKEECGFSDYEDNITLEDYKLLKNNSNDAVLDVNKLLEGALQQIKVEAEHKVKKVKKEKDRRKQKRKDVDQILDVEVPSKKRLRNPPEIDTTKIEIITLDAEEEVRQRRESFDAEKFPHRCNFCYIGFNYDYKLNNHMKKHNPERGRFSCVHCAMYFPSAYSYKVHSYTHTRRYRCTACHRVMRDYLTIYNHYRSLHEGITPIFTCEICGKISNNSKTHRGHMRNSHGSRPECVHCGKTFVNLSSLTEHLQIHQGVKNFECNKCGKKFRTRNQVQHHQTMHSDARDYYCVECDTRFKTAQNLKQHLERSLKHKDKGSFKFACNECGRRVESAAQLSRHVSIHHEGLRLFPCSQCDSSLSTRNALRKHERVIHHNMRPEHKHVCDHCGRTFTARTTLVNHVRTHTGEKPFSCVECGRRFAQKTALTTHDKLVHRKIGRKPARKPEPQIEPDVKPARVYDAWGRSADPTYFTVSAGP